VAPVEPDVEPVEPEVPLEPVQPDRGQPTPQQQAPTE
jgi:hypothetical protein